MLDGEVAVGAFVDERRDPVTVHRPGGERPEDKEVQSSLDQRKRMRFRHASLRRCGESGGWLDPDASRARHEWTSVIDAVARGTNPRYFGTRGLGIGRAHGAEPRRVHQAG